MEYLGGGEVKWRDNQNRPVLTVSQTRRILRDAVLGLEYRMRPIYPLFFPFHFKIVAVHHQGIIHRDIKPANLLWTEDRRQVKIGDFGVSHFSYAQRLASAGGRDINDDPYDPILLDESGLTRRAGTPSFLAPEVISEHVNESASLFSSTSQSSPSESPATSTTPTSSPTTPTAATSERPQITKSIDIWALGVTLYCLLFGCTPFHAGQTLSTTGSEFSLYNAICNDDWDVQKTMGYDRIPTRGRHPNPSSEGASIINLLDRFLQKDYHARITLDDVKVCLIMLDSFLLSSLIWVTLGAESHFILLASHLRVDIVADHSVHNPQGHPWVLEGLDDPTHWISVTSPKTSPIHVSVHETSDAMSAVHFRWRWGGRFVQQVSSLLRGVRPLTRQELHPGRGVQRQLQYRQVGVNSVPESGRLRKPAATVQLQGSEEAVPFPSAADGKKDKGKAKATNQHSPKALKRPSSKGGSKSLRSKSIERWPQALRGTNSISTSELQGSNSKARRGSDTKIWTGEMDIAGSSRGASGSSASSPITPNVPNNPLNGRSGSGEKRARFASIFQGISNWRPNKYAPASTSTTRHHAVVASPIEYVQLPSSRIVVPSPAPNTRRSEEALRYYGQSASIGAGIGFASPPMAFDADDPDAGALLTAARRASSWGQGDTELTELVSVQSVGQDLNEQEMNVGAGGIAREGISVPAVGGLPSVVAASTSASEAVAKAIVNSRRLSMTPVAASGSGSNPLAAGAAAGSGPSGGLDVSLTEEDIQRYGPPVFDDTSTIGSVDQDGDDDPEWRRGSELDDFYDDDDPADGDDASREFSEDEDEEEEAGVTFSPRRHGPTNH